MTNEITPAAVHSVRAVDSLIANEFVLHIDDEPVTGIFTISGLTSFKLEVKTTNQLKKVQAPFKITKMVQRDPNNIFNKWLRETLSVGTDIVRPSRTLTIVAVDNGVAIRRWVVKKAWVSAVSYSDFDSGSSELIEETIEIQYDDIEESWPMLEGQG